MPETLVIADERTRVEIIPELGGGIAAMDAMVDGNPVPVLRAWSGRPSDGPFALALNVLVPFSNRISGGGFAFGGIFHVIEPNLPGEHFPIHGDGFARPWTVDSATTTAASLRLPDGDIGPFRYRAEMAYVLRDGALTISLSVVNRAARPLPYGAGFHPWFPRTDQTTLQFAAEGAWHEDPNHLPTTHVGIASVPHWNFEEPRLLPQTWINNAFTGWRGSARIDQPAHGIAATVAGSPNLHTAIVYSPGADADFFCFEPVSHAVDAHNRKGFPGLALLDHGESLSVMLTLGWQSRAAALSNCSQ